MRENILTWLGQRERGEPGTPRRLVCALPQRGDPVQAATEVRALGLPEEIALHVVMASPDESRGDWREDMHKPAIIIGTADVLLAKALMRGYDTGRALAPIDFALVTNGARWILPDADLCPQTAATLTRIAQFTTLYGTAEPLTFSSVHPVAGEHVSVLARPGFLDLFDTETEADIASYVCDGAELDAQVVRAAWIPGEDGAPDPEIQPPPAGYRRRVPLGEVEALAKSRPVWRRHQGEWIPLTERARPYEVLLVHDDSGPELLRPSEGAGAAAEKRPWQSLDDHSEQTRDQAEALLRVLSPDLPPGAARSAVVAAYLHDAGKAHETWQDALCALAPPEDAARIAAGRPWAKSGTTGVLEFADGVSFRHELASLLLIDGPLRDLLAESPDPDLTRYLVLAHHGRLRLQVRDPADPTGETILGLTPGATSGIPPMLNHPASTLTVALDQFAPGAAWSRTAESLLARYGPFTIAYLETVVRIADWRASGGRELPG